ncbi:HTH domain-containing protein, partial [Paenibacillus sp. CGMCC 1.18879]|uniref:HTH domain-containing protein n=2 Tax=Paenibacillus TaxID=44249 RepID=UPI001CA871B9
MSKKLFSKAEQDQLSKNKYITKISDKAVTYSDEFKRLFIDQYMEGKTPREIFIAQGFDVEILGMKRVEQSADRWKKAYERGGIIGLADSRKESSGRSLSRERTPEEIIAKQDARIKLLESQLELLKKADTKERWLVAKGRNLSKNKLFELIHDAVEQGFKRMTHYLCELLNVSRSGYYSYLKAADSRIKRARLDAEVGELVKKAFCRRGFKKGARSIKMVLENDFDIIYNRKRIRRHMRNLNLVCPHRKPNPYRQMANATQE